MIDAALHEYKEKPGSCADCGNSPINHIESYISQTMSVWSAGRSYRSRASIFGFFRRAIDRVAAWFEPIFFRIIASVPGTRFAADPTKARTYRSQVVWEEAVRRGIEMQQLVFWGTYTDIYRARIRKGWFYFISIPLPPEMENRGGEWMDDKFLLKHVLAEGGVPTPRVASVTSLSEAKRALRDFGTAVVVKPRSGSRARHTTVDVREESELETAFKSARKLCRYVVIEEYLRGGVCRATVVSGKLAGFFQGLPPIVTGDGTSTIAELIEKKNADKPPRVADIVITDDHRAFLQRGGRSVETVPAEGESVAVTPRTGRLFGGRTRELFGFEHPKLRAYMERAARALHTPLVGFDLIIENPEADPDAQRWGIIEANSLPYIDLHYLPLEGTPSNVAAAVWDLWRKAYTDGV